HQGPEEAKTVAESAPTFWLGKYEVTQEEYQKITGTYPAHFSSTGEGKEAVAGLITTSFPVENVSWDDAMNFCQKLTERDLATGLLPPEWEYTLPSEIQ